MAEEGSLSEEPRAPVDPGLPLLDRSRGRLRLPAELMADALELAHAQAMAHLGARALSDIGSAETLGRMAGVMDGEQLDPIAVELLEVVNQASLLVAVDVSYGPDSSAATIWATPRRAVCSNSIDPTQMELELMPVSQLPQVLAQLIVVQRPAFVGDGPMSVGVQTLSEALGRPSRDEAVEVLAGDGLDRTQSLLLLDLQLPEVRRWRINSSWSTEDGPDESELRGLDAGPNGQWLETTTAGDGSAQGLRTLTPLGHGEAMSALRSVLPRNWMGTPLKQRTS